MSQTELAKKNLNLPNQRNAKYFQVRHCEISVLQKHGMLTHITKDTMEYSTDSWTCHAWMCMCRDFIDCCS